MFVEYSHSHREYVSATPIYHNYISKHTAPEIFRQIFLDYHFQTPFEDLDLDIAFIQDTINMEIYLILNSLFYS